MSPKRALRGSFGWKLFLSYLVVILTGVVMLAIAAELAIPRSFNRHMAAMGSMMGGMMGGAPMGMDVEADLFRNYRAAVTEALLIAALAALAVAILVSIYVSQRVVSPLRAVRAASQRIAEGHYAERVSIPGSLDPEAMDELAELAVSFNQMAARLDQTETMRQRLIGDVAHELRTPLTAIKGAMEGLLDGVVKAKPESFNQVYQEADRLQRLVDDLQELSRIEAGRLELRMQPVQLGELARRTASRLQRQFEDKGVELSVIVEEAGLTVRADPDRMTQVLLNLIGNALQYTPPGGSARVRVDRAGKEARVVVSDTGIGIPAEHLPHVFTRFYRVDKSRSRAGGGSGVGLTIARHLVEAQHGRIWAESPGADQGTTFSIALPPLKT